MLADLLGTNYDSDNALNLVNSVRSYIKLTLDNETKAPEFITDLRRKLYFIHEYNCQVAKFTDQYPRSRKLDLLLIKYVELEYDVLYHNNPHPPRCFEVESELRVLRLLQLMLYPAVLNDEPLVNKNTDRTLKRAVLQLLGEVRSTYLVKNKLVCNIASKLLKIIHGNRRKPSTFNKNKNLAVTSDYGTDDSDSDFENVFTNPLFLRHHELDSSERTSDSDCVEVLPAPTGIAPIPTIEFTDDDDIYFVYLQKNIPTKRKFQDDRKAVRRKKKSADVSKENVNSQDELQNSTKKCIQSSCNDEQHKVTKASTDTTVIICSDSEDEISEVATNQASVNKCETKSNNRSDEKRNQTGKTNAAVVTFEILDDDDDDDDQINYMVYLQKEVKTNTMSKKDNEKTIEEIAICSDSEDNSSPEKLTEKTNEICTSSQIHEFSNKTSSSPHHKRPSNTRVNTECTPNNESNFSAQRDKNTIDEIVQPINVFSVNKNSRLQNRSLINVSNCDEKLNSELDSVCQETQVQPSASNSAPVDPVFLLYSNDEIPTNIEGDCNSNSFVDPSTILEQMNPTNLNKNEITTLSYSSSTQIDEVAEETDLRDNIGGPVLSEKIDELEDLGNTSECRLNESLLEEILRDDNYLLEGRKEFEELEYFLFNDSIEKQGFSLSNFSFDDNETIQQPETFHADIQSLESYLNDSHLIDVTQSQLGTSLGSSTNSFSNNECNKREHLKLNFTCRRLNPERHVKNTMYNESWKKNKRDSRVKDLSVFEQYKQVNTR